MFPHPVLQRRPAAGIVESGFGRIDGWRLIGCGHPGFQLNQGLQLALDGLGSAIPSVNFKQKISLTRHGMNPQATKSCPGATCNKPKQTLKTKTNEQEAEQNPKEPKRDRRQG
jgi:hypothetical protein